MEKLIKAKKAQKLQKGVTVAVVLIISVVVLLQIFASLVPEAQSAGEDFSDVTKCGDVGCFFDTGLDSCQTNSSAQGFGGNSSEACLVAIPTIPLSSLFGSSGIVIILLMVALFLGIIKAVIPKSKK